MSNYKKIDVECESIFYGQETVELYKCKADDVEAIKSGDGLLGRLDRAQIIGFWKADNADAVDAIATMSDAEVAK